MPFSDQTLLERWAQTRDADAFAEIVTRHSVMVFGTCLRILRNAASAEEVAQESFLELAQKAGQIRSSLGGWLHSTAAHRALDRVRQDKQRQVREAQFAEAATGFQAHEWDDLWASVDKAIAQLPEELREVIVQRFLEGQTQDAIAANLGIAPPTVRYRINKGVESIRQFLKTRGLVVSAAAVVSALDAGAVTPVPATLTATLGKTALAGLKSFPPVPTGVFGTTAASAGYGVLALMKTKIAAGVLVVGILLALVMLLSPHEEAQEANPEEISVSAHTRHVAHKTSPEKPTPSSTPKASKTQASLTLPDVGPIQNASKPVAPATISGRVTDSDQKGLAGACVELVIGGGATTDGVASAVYSVKTDTHGTYRIDNIVVFGKAQLTASAEGYVSLPARGGARFTVPRLALVEENEEYRKVDFELLKVAARIQGRVVDPAKAPIAGARILVAKQFGDVERASQEVFSALSDASGRFDIALPSEGECILTVYRKGYGAGYFPDVIPQDKNLELMLRAGGAIAGTVRTTDGKPAAGIHLGIMGEGSPGDGNPWEAPETTKTVTGPDGTYRADDLGETFAYTVRAGLPEKERKYAMNAPGTAAEFLCGREYVLADFEAFRFGQSLPTGLAERKGVVVYAGQTTSVDLVIDKGNLQPRTLFGAVTDTATGDPVPMVYVHAVTAAVSTQDPSSPFVLESGQEEVAAAITQADGSYHLAFFQEQPGLMEIVVQAGQDTLGSPERSTPVGTISLEPGEETRFDFRFPASITVPVHAVSSDNKPMAGMNVSNAESDEDGRLTLYGLAPNETHQLTAERFDRKSRNYIPCGRSDAFSGKPGETVPEVTIVCNVPHGAVEGRIVLPESMTGYNSIVGDRILCHLNFVDGPQMVSGWAPVTSDGRFRLEEALTGTCALIFTFWDSDTETSFHARTGDSVEILPDQTTEIGDLVFSPQPAQE